MEYLFIYLLQIGFVIENITKIFLPIVIAILLGLSFLYFMTSFAQQCPHYDEDEKIKENAFFKKNIKRFVVCLIILLALNLIPTKQTLLLMGGTYLGKKAVNAVITDEKIKKVDTIINLQLDKYIKELQGKEVTNELN